MSTLAKRSIPIILLALFLSLGSANFAFACTCYGTDTSKVIDATAECQVACGETTGVTEKDGICSCPSKPDESTEISCETVCSTVSMSHEPPSDSADADYVQPELNVDIPGLSFSEALKKDGNLEITWLGDYVSAFYQYLVGIGTLVAIIMIMIGGLQYTFAAGGGSTAKAKKRINNAIVGLTLLLSVFMILFIVNPNLVFFDAVKLLEVNEVKLDLDTSGNEGYFPSGGGGEVCDNIVQQAKDNGSCAISASVISPTGGKPGCGNHHWFDGGANGEYQNINKLDYPAGWGANVVAPIGGTLTYKQQTDDNNRCGNRVTINGTGDFSGASLVICHMKDFVNDSGEVLNGKEVEQGDVIGHIGGNCCKGETPPSSWSASQRGWCDVTGTQCSSPWSTENCACQDYQQGGNTSGPHVHMTWYKGGDLLNCLDY